MSLWVVRAKHPKTGAPTDWFFDDMFEAGKAYALAESERGGAIFRHDYISDFDEFRNWFMEKE